MPYPIPSEIEEALLKLIFLRGGSDFKIKSSDAYQPLADYFRLTEQERIKPRIFPDERYEPEWNNRVQWARNELMKAGYLAKPPKRSVWQLSVKGIAEAQWVLSEYKVLRSTFGPQRQGQAPSDFEGSIFDNTPTLLDVEGLNISVQEGGKTLISHFRSERNAKIVNDKKKQVLKATGKLICEACGFDFAEFYGQLGYGFCEAHHKKPLAEIGERTETKLEDLALVCSNCHRMIHRTKPMKTIQQFKKLIRGAM